MIDILTKAACDLTMQGQKLKITVVLISQQKHFKSKQCSVLHVSTNYAVDLITQPKYFMSKHVSTWKLVDKMTLFIKFPTLLFTDSFKTITEYIFILPLAYW